MVGFDHGSLKSKQRPSDIRYAIFHRYAEYPLTDSSRLQSLGLAESTFYPGMQYIIGSWYRKDELAKRSCIFHTSSGLGSMFSGYLMAAVYHLGGRGGFKGWQWYGRVWQYGWSQSWRLIFVQVVHHWRCHLPTRCSGRILHFTWCTRDQQSVVLD